MKTLSKFSGPNLIATDEFTHPNLWQREDHESWSRLAIGAEKNEIPLILDFCNGKNGQFGILYILISSRLGRESARYQSPYPINFDELSLFLYTFQEYFEQDGRHHLWIMSLEDNDQFIFDNHNIVYSYGNIDEHETILQQKGFTQGEVGIPAPHAHNYHPEFDLSEDELMNYWDWINFPLEDYDDP